MSDQLAKELSTLSESIATSLNISTTPDQSSPFQGANRITESSSHDFTSYLFALEPLTRGTIGVDLSQKEEELFRLALASAVNTAVPNMLTETRIGRVGNYEGSYDIDQSDYDWDRSKDPLYNNAALSEKLFRSGFLNSGASLISAAVSQLDSLNREAYLVELATAYHDKLVTFFSKKDWSQRFYSKGALVELLLNNEATWFAAASVAIESVEFTASANAMASKTQTYGSGEFTPFEPRTVNFGVQLVYRQVWSPKGVQTGDIVKTIPLGPGQKEKVIIKSIRRDRRTRSFENKRTIEQTSELTSSSRDSSEVVGEASSSSNWNVEVSAEASFGYASASISGKTGGEQAQSSRDSKSKANEAMQKAADKLRTETKVIVESEVESTDSIERISEIHNANDEIAVTYVYSKLQRQYEVYTYLAEVNTVAYVAEYVINNAELSHEWFERNATVMRRSLLDVSLNNDLELVLSRSYFLMPESPAEDGNRDPRIGKIMDSIVANGLPNYANAQGTPPDVLTSVLAQYQSDKTDALTRVEDYRSYQQSLQRLIAHVSSNALHYSKAIWASEDADMRMMRYRNILVPKSWQETNPVGNGYGKADRYNPSMFVPVLDEDNPMVRLTDIINPAGPVGLAGNYLVFDLKNSHEIAHIDAPLAILRSSYTQKVTWFDASEDIHFIGLLKPTFQYPAMELEIELTVIDHSEEGANVQFEIFVRSSVTGMLDNKGEEIIAISADGRIDGDNISGVFVHSGESLSSIPEGLHIKGKSVMTTNLEDPDFSAYKYTYFVSTYINAEKILTKKVIETLSNKNSDAIEGLGINEQTVIAELSPSILIELVDIYLMYEFVDSNTRQVLLDTDNVVLSRVVDNATSLEPYKASHRLIDLLKTIEELRQDLSESQRYAARLNAGDFDDPEIDTRIQVEGWAGINVNPQS